MASGATAQVLESSRPVLRAIPGYGGGPPRAARELVVSNARLGLLVLLAAETMLFMGLVGAYIVFRTASASWPPAGLPQLPLLVTWLNTVVLLGSGYTMHLAREAARVGDRYTLIRRLVLTAALGVIFLVVQGSEWARLVHYGLTISSGTYGASFYTLIGLHGAHVLGAVVWLVGVSIAARVGHRLASYAAVDVCAMYWTYVVGLWVALFALVYLV